MMNTANTVLEARASSFEKNTGNGVNIVLVARENRISPM